MASRNDSVFVVNTTGRKKVSGPPVPVDGKDPVTETVVRALVKEIQGTEEFAALIAVVVRTFLRGGSTTTTRRCIAGVDGAGRCPMPALPGQFRCGVHERDAER